MQMDDDEAETTVTGTTWGEEQARGLGRGYVITARDLLLLTGKEPNRATALEWFRSAYPQFNATERKAFLAGFDEQVKGAKA